MGKLSRREFLYLTWAALGATVLNACSPPDSKSTATIPPTDTATETKTATPTSTATATQTKTATPTSTATATETKTATPTSTATATETPAPEVGRFNVEGVLTYSDAYSRVEIDSGTGFSASINIPDQLMVNTKDLFSKIDYPAGFVTMMGKIQLYEMMKEQYVFSGGTTFTEVANNEYVSLAKRIAYVDEQLAVGPIKVDFVADAKISMNGKLYDGGKGEMHGEIRGVDTVFVSTLDELGALRDKLGRDPDVSVFVGDTNSILYLEGGRLIQGMVAPETSPDPWGYSWVKFSDYDVIRRNKSGVVTDFIRLVLEKGLATTQWLVGSDATDAYWPGGEAGYFRGATDRNLRSEVIGLPGCETGSKPYGCESFYDKVFVW